MQEFVAETRDTLQAISGEIVAWEAAPGDRTRLDSIFRFVHTVKGSCGFLDLPRLERLSHAAEDVLAEVRDGTRTPDTALVNAVLAIVDRIGEIVEAIDAGSPLDDSGEDLLIAALAEDAQPVAPSLPTLLHRPVNRSIRLNVDLLDRMMSGMSDMVLARNELARRLRDASPDPRVEAALERLSVTVAEMRDTVTRTRMQKIEALFSALPRMVRDTAAELGKTVALTIDGADVELDREMIEMMRDPLVHIVRNAIDHGIEAPEARAAAGKPATGNLRICARQSGNQILIEITDDGAGINVERVCAKALAQGLHTEAQIAAMTPAERVDLILLAGLSSRDSVTAISGRGVGMDVVRANIEQIGGQLALSNRPGQGLSLTIEVPLTLSIIPTIVIGIGDQRFALARPTVEEIVKLRGAVRIDTIGDSHVVSLRGRRLPLVDLGRLLGIPVESPSTTLAIVASRSGTYALAVGAVLDSEELVVKPASPVVMASGLFAGQTLPDSGLPMLLLDGGGIAAAAGLKFDAVPIDVAEDGVDETPGVPALLFADLDGCRRAIALSVVDRVEPVPINSIRHKAGRLRLSIGRGIVPLHACAAIPEDGEVAVLRLTDGETEIAYAIAEAIEIVTLPANIAPTFGAGPIAGVVMIEGDQVELIDPHALFAGEPAAPTQSPLCLIAADGWMDVFLRPVLEASGYRCVTRLAAGEKAAVALVMEGAAEAGGDSPVVRLRRDVAKTDPDAATVYRYDRQALLAAVAAVSHGKAA